MSDDFTRSLADFERQFMQKHYAPRPAAPVPTASIDAIPRYSPFPVNEQWLEHLIGVLGVLDEYDAWIGTEEEINVARSDVRRFIASFVKTNEVQIDFSNGLQGLELFSGVLDTENGWVIGTAAQTLDIRWNNAVGETLLWAEMDYYSARPSGTNGNIRWYHPQTTLAEQVSLGVGWHFMATGDISVVIPNFIRFAVNPDATTPNEHKISRVLMIFAE
jgi:hypothetical protein